MVVMMEVSNDGSSIQMYNWYPSKQISVEVRDLWLLVM
jgi:hypothetical protein